MFFYHVSASWRILGGLGDCMWFSAVRVNIIEMCKFGVGFGDIILESRKNGSNGRREGGWRKKENYVKFGGGEIIGDGEIEIEDMGKHMVVVLVIELAG